MNDKKISCCQKLRALIKLVSLFQIDNGIFHQNRRTYTSPSSLAASTLLLILIFMMITYKLIGINQVNSIDTYTLDMTLMNNYKMIEPDYSILPARIDAGRNIIGIQADSLGHFPIVIWNQGVTCSDIL